MIQILRFLFVLLEPLILQTPPSPGSISSSLFDGFAMFLLCPVLKTTQPLQIVDQSSTLHHLAPQTQPPLPSLKQSTDCSPASKTTPESPLRVRAKMSTKLAARPASIRSTQ